MNIITVDLRYVLAFQITLMVHIMFPDLIPRLSQYMIKKWVTQRSRWFEKRNRNIIEKHQNFWEIDMRKLK